MTEFSNPCTGGVTLERNTKRRCVVCGVCSDLGALVRGVGFRASDGQSSCVTGFGSGAWERLFGAPRPKELHPFCEIRGRHLAVATPGDILFHIRTAHGPVLRNLTDASKKIPIFQ